MAASGVKVSAAGARRIRAGHPWVFRADVSTPAAEPGGEVVRVVDAHGNLLGQAFWAERSPIALRMLTRREETCDRAFFAERVRRALAARRDRLGGMEAGRLIHGEADLLPGLFVDRYADALALQAVSEGAEARTALWVELLREQVAARLIVAKNDTSARDFEGLPREQRVLDGGPNAEATFVEGQNRFTLDLLADLKTGAFLDQRENHGRAAELVPEGGRALDLFSYHGGFALALGIRAGEVLAVELDEVAAARLAENARENRRPVTVRQENAFDVLRELERAAQRFDVVVLDPPAFAKRKGDLPAATRAYKELNLRALRLVEPGGILITCSCSGRMTPDRFGAVIAEAVADVKRPVQILERRGAAGDHPVLFGVPETEYLKAWVLRVL